MTFYKTAFHVACVLIGGLGGFALLGTVGAALGTVLGLVAGKWLSKQIMQDLKETI